MKDKLPVEIATLPDGRHRIVCPSCGGGSDRSKTLSVDIQGSSVKYYCFRASCAFRKNSNLNYVHNKCTKVNYAQDRDLYGYVRYPIYDNDMECQGWEHRAISKKTKPKSKLNTNSDYCNLSFQSRVNQDVVLLVEDRLSAKMMNPFFSCVALMGVHLNKDKVDYLISIGVKRAVIALDADATAQAIKISRTESLICGIMILRRDIKDEPMHTVLNLAQELHEKYNTEIP